VDREQQPRWLKRVLWISGSILTLVVVLVLIRLGYAYRATGFGQYKVNGEVQPFKTLWDWFDLLIVPIVLALGGYLFTRSENQRTQEIARETRQEDTLQAYFDGMSQLLTDKDRPLHRTLLGDNLSTVARARTLTVLSRLDGDRKARIVQFLFESGLIARDYRVLSLEGADLRGANLSEANLRMVDLSEADLRGAYLYRTNLSEAHLPRADLSNADLSNADLGRSGSFMANLSGANLYGTNLFQANLALADLREANLSEADLRGAYLSNANLKAVKGITPQQLFASASMYMSDSLDWGWLPDDVQSQLSMMGDRDAALARTTLPNGQKYEDWLKDRKAQGKDEKNQ
jgi:uncharacterized protein YjbI with pentapeptide repeats